MASWQDSRLVVQVDGETITPIDSFTPTFALNAEVIHSIEATHIGYIASPENFTFNMSVRAIGDAAARLAKLAMQGTQFQIAVHEAQGSAGEWEFKEILLDGCLITSANPSNATINGAPAATFSGVARSAKTTSSAGDAFELPEFPSA